MKDEDNCEATLPLAALEQNFSHERMGKKKTKGLDTRVNIYVRSYRKAKHDPDGVSAKATIDGLVKAGVLADDSTNEVRKVTFESVKVKEYEEERTEIHIEFNDECLKT
jgi:Holliday junction resolvase RusA-like endonuclease